jgi:uncharacterized BrkB/YihY/UPF0761 family membrane protein
MKKKGLKKLESKNSIPTGVKIISVLYFIGAFFCILAALSVIIFSGPISDSLSQMPASELEEIGTLGWLSQGLFVGLGIIILLFGLFAFFIARGLWKGKNWARITAIVLAALGIISNLSSITLSTIIGDLINAAISALIGGYLLLNKEVKKAFLK